MTPRREAALLLLIAFAVAAAWHQLYVQPRKAALRLIADCMTDNSQSEYRRCAATIHPPGVPVKDLKLMTRFLRCTRLVTGGDAPEGNARKLNERDLGPWPANEDGTRPEGRGLWSRGLDLAQLNVLAAIPEEEEEPPFVYRKFRVYDDDGNLIAEGDGIFHTEVDWSWTEPLGFAAQTWNAADIEFFEGGKWVSRD